MRIVLLGRTGTGRSSSGNTILGTATFLVDASPSSVTTQCQRKTCMMGGRAVCVIDTPGFFHTRLPPEKVMAEVGRCVIMSSPGPHAFLLTLQPSRFTQEERDTLEGMIKATFGPGAARFSLVLFTWGDQLQGKSIEDFLAQSPGLSEFVNSCRGGYQLFDNTGRDKSTERLQVVQLLKKIDKMVADNKGECYSDEMFKEAEKAMKKVQERILGEQSSIQEKDENRKDQGTNLERRGMEEEEEARKRAERLFWCELASALGRGAAEGAGLVGKDKGKAVKKVKVVEKAAALAASPLSIRSAARVVEGAVREGSKVLYKHRKTLLH